MNFIVMATASNGSSDGTTYCVGTYDSFEKAQWAALNEFCINWVQGEWNRYDPEFISEFRRALKKKNPKLALELQSGFSDLRFSIEDMTACSYDARPFDIEDQFD